MKKKILFLSVFLFSLNSFCQIEKEVNNVLSKRNFIKFKTYSEKLTNSAKGISAYWVNYRELTNGYSEGIFHIEKSVPHKDNSGISDLFIFQVNIIATDKEIIYYDLGEQKNKKVNNEWVPYYITLHKFRSDSLFNKLKIKFALTFDSPLNEKELFIDEVYGQSCGNGNRPEKGVQIDTWVKANDKINLLKWLQTTNTEKQIYAVEGFFKLKQKGIALTKRESEIIKVVLRKKGTVHICSGCMHTTSEISEVTKGFKF